MAKSLGSEKTGGRKKGTPNKKTICFEEALKKNKIDIIEQIGQLLPQLSVDRRADILLNLMSYQFPKRKALEVSSEISANVQIENEPSLTEEEIAQKIKEVQAESKIIAKKLMLLDETPKEAYVRMKLEDEFDKLSKISS